MVDGSLEGKKENIKQEAGKFDKKKGKPGGMEENKSEGGKTAICNSFCSVCVCVFVHQVAQVAVYVCVCLLAACMCSSINVPGLISHTMLCFSLADGTT